MAIRTCADCEEEKPLGEFHSKGTGKLSTRCKACVAIRGRSLVFEPDPTIAEKCCTKCKATKPVAEFGKTKRRKDGYNAWCKACWYAAEYQRRQAPERKAAIAAKRRAHWAANRETMQVYTRERLARYKATPEGRAIVQRITRASNIRKKYGISLEDFDALLAAQDGRCAICETTEPKGNGAFHIDHDHASGEIRGLLCHACNTALGLLGESPARLDAAAAYLQRPRHLKLVKS